MGKTIWKIFLNISNKVLWEQLTIMGCNDRFPNNIFTEISSVQIALKSLLNLLWEMGLIHDKECFIPHCPLFQRGYYFFRHLILITSVSRIIFSQFAILFMFTIFNLPPTTQSVNTGTRCVPIFTKTYISAYRWTWTTKINQVIYPDITIVVSGVLSQGIVHCIKYATSATDH